MYFKPIGVTRVRSIDKSGICNGGRDVPIEGAGIGDIVGEDPVTSCAPKVEKERDWRGGCGCPLDGGVLTCVDGVVGLWF